MPWPNKFTRRRLWISHIVVSGEDDPNRLTALSRRRLKSKKEQLVDSLEANITEYHRFLLKQHLKQFKFLNDLIGEFDERIEKQVRSFFEYIPLPDTIPGVNQNTAEELIAEPGVNMNQFPDYKHLPRGKQRALVAVGYTILNIAYRIIKYRKPYYELGEDFFEKLNMDRFKYYYSRRLEDLGYTVESTRNAVA